MEKKHKKDLFDGFGSHWVDEAGRRPVQDDGADGAERFEEDDLLQVWLAVSLPELAVPLLLRHVVTGQNLMGYPLLLILEPIAEADFFFN